MPVEDSRCWNHLKSAASAFGRKRPCKAEDGSHKAEHAEDPELALHGRGSLEREGWVIVEGLIIHRNRNIRAVEFLIIAIRGNGCILVVRFFVIHGIICNCHESCVVLERLVSADRNSTRTTV